MPEKGPPIYLDYDQAALDAAYDQAAYAPNREQLIKRRIRDSELTRLRIGEPERVAYGELEIERLDFYRTRRDAALCCSVGHLRGYRGRVNHGCCGLDQLGVSSLAACGGHRPGRRCLSSGCGRSNGRAEKIFPASPNR